MLSSLIAGLGLRQYLIIAGAVAVIGLVVIAKKGWHDEGERAALDRVNKANTEVMLKADEVENLIKACGERGWNRETKSCAR